MYQRYSLSLFRLVFCLAILFVVGCGGSSGRPFDYVANPEGGNVDPNRGNGSVLVDTSQLTAPSGAVEHLVIFYPNSDGTGGELATHRLPLERSLTFPSIPSSARSLRVIFLDRFGFALASYLTDVAIPSGGSASVTPSGDDEENLPDYTIDIAPQPLRVGVGQTGQIRILLGYGSMFRVELSRDNLSALTSASLYSMTSSNDSVLAVTPPDAIRGLAEGSAALLVTVDGTTSSFPVEVVDSIDTTDTGTSPSGTTAGTAGAATAGSGTTGGTGGTSANGGDGGGGTAGTTAGNGGGTGATAGNGGNGDTAGQPTSPLVSIDVRALTDLLPLNGSTTNLVIEGTFGDGSTSFLDPSNFNFVDLQGLVDIGVDGTVTSGSTSGLAQIRATAKADASISDIVSLNVNTALGGTPELLLGPDISLRVGQNYLVRANVKLSDGRIIDVTDHPDFQLVPAGLLGGVLQLVGGVVNALLPGTVTLNGSLNGIVGGELLNLNDSINVTVKLL